MTEDALPQSDQVAEAPHPRETVRLFGQDRAENTFLDAFTGDRLHHAWLITGPRGIGKATLAWRIARFLLATPSQNDDGLFGAPAPPETLDIPADHPVNAHVQSLAHPGLYLLRRAYDEDKKRFKANIGVEDIRAMSGFFGLTNTEGGRRVVILDAADDMNVNAANALLKILEEPPQDAILLLISHQPSGLLPTIRSRCRVLRCAPLGTDDMAAALAQAGAGTSTLQAVAGLSRGSVGEALRLIHGDGLEMYKTLLGLAESLPRMDRPAALKLAADLSARGKEARFDLFERLVELFLARLSRAGLGVLQSPVMEGEPAVLARLSPGPRAARAWAELSAKSLPRLRHGRAVNLDPQALILDMLWALNQTAAREAA